MRTDLKVLRVKNHYTQKDLAARLNVSISTYNLVEQGKRKGSVEFWFGIKKIYNLEDGQVWKLQQNK